jgi:hypothetical protein
VTFADATMVSAKANGTTSVPASTAFIRIVVP